MAASLPIKDAMQFSNSSWTVTVPKSPRDDEQPIGHCCKQLKTDYRNDMKVDNTGITAG